MRKSITKKPTSIFIRQTVSPRETALMFRAAKLGLFLIAASAAACLYPPVAIGARDGGAADGAKAANGDSKADSSDVGGTANGGSNGGRGAGDAGVGGSGGSRGSVDAKIPDAPGAQRDVPMGGVGGGATARASATGGIENPGGSGGSNTGGLSTGGIAGTGGLGAGGITQTGGSSVGGITATGGTSICQILGTAPGPPTNVVITAISASPGATCVGSGCRVPSGGSATLTAPASVGDYVFASWTGAAGCSSASPAVTLSNVTADTTCIANYQATYLVTITVVGGPAGKSITPTSATPGATCIAGSCRVPSGGAVVAAAPALTDWFFNGWSGDAVAATSTVTLTDIAKSATITATYINQREDPCANQPPSNATTTSTPTVLSTYTTAGGWPTPAMCPWTCNTDYCKAGTFCAPTYLDQIAFLIDTADMWFGGDDRSSEGPRSVGAGQGVTPTDTVSMDRFAFNLGFSFKYSTTGALGTQANIVELDVRDASGVIQASYTTTLAANFPGGWVYWNTPTTTLSAGVLYIFTSYLTTAFVQKVNAGILADQTAAYPGGSGYAGEVTSGDLSSWTSWSKDQWDFDFRVQQHNPACSH
jgi:hypothetical protein